MGLFKQPEYKRFNLKPRYWDPEAEARNEREKRIRKELGLEDEQGVYIPDVRSSLRREYHKRQIARQSQASMKRTFRLFFILIMLLVLGFYLMTYKLDVIMKMFNL